MVVKKKKTKSEDVKEKVDDVSKSLKKKESSQLTWFFGIVIFVFLAFIGTYFYVQSLKTFEYAHVDWLEEDYEGLTLFHTRFPIVYNGVYVANYNMYLRNDPRENDIPVQENFKVKFWPEIIISNSEDAARCSGAVRITGDLGMFLAAFPPVKNITGAVRDKGTSQNLNLTQADCSLAEGKTVILIQKSSSPEVSVDKFNENCYILRVGDCENVKVVEKFMVEIVRQLNEGTS